MANNVIGVFDSTSVADQVINDLTRSGFDKSSIHRYEGTTSDLEGELQRVGISADDARDYAESMAGEGALVIAQADDTRTDDAVEIMNRYYNTQSGDAVAGDTEDVTAEYASGAADTEGTTFEVAEEQLRIGKRSVDRGGVRIRSVVSETPVEEQVTLRDETINVDRQAVDRPITDADTSVFNEQTVELTETDEEAVVAKEGRVVEEVTVGKEVGQRTETVRDTARRTDVEVEELGRTYGENLAADERYAGREWNDVEADARADWERDNQGKNTWDDVKGDVRDSWEKRRK